MADVYTWVTLKVKYSAYGTFQAAVLLKFQIISLANGELLYKHIQWVGEKSAA